MLLGREKNDSTDFGQAKSRAHVQRRKNGFDRHCGGLELFDEAAQERVDVVETGTSRRLAAFRRNLERTIAQHAQLTAAGFDDRITGGTRGGWVYP
jgi:hypothetical protein